MEIWKAQGAQDRAHGHAEHRTALGMRICDQHWREIVPWWHRRGISQDTPQEVLKDTLETE